MARKDVRIYAKATHYVPRADGNGSDSRLGDVGRSKLRFANSVNIRRKNGMRINDVR